MTRGKFITLEGIDGAGKSTHLADLRELAEARGVRVIQTREPGGTPLGESLRELLLTREMHADTELMLMFAARAEHVYAHILPALERGEWVICDRFSDASYAYQGGGRGIERARLVSLERWVLGDFQPDLTLLFDIDPELALVRRHNARAADRFEAQQLGFFIRVRDAYLERAREFPQRFRIVDASRSREEVRAELARIFGDV